MQSMGGGGARGKGCTDILYFRGGGLGGRVGGKGCTDILYFRGG